jgi:type II secretory pathway pseudopilin PulG
MRRRGFVMIDLLIATVIIGLAVMALMQLAAVGTESNRETVKLTMAMQLADNVHEFARMLSLTRNTSGNFVRPTGIQPSDAAFNNVCYLDGFSFTSPIDADGNYLANGVSGYSIRCTVTSFEPKAPATAVSPTNTNVRRLTVYVDLNGKNVHSETWMMAPTVPVS